MVLLICAYVFNEYSFDKSFTHHRRIYRANSYATMGNVQGIMTSSSNALALAAIEQIPGVETAVRVMAPPMSPNAKVDNDLFKVERFHAVDENFFLLFNTPFIYGSAEEVFARPNMIALAETLAKKYFGDRDPIGEILLLDGEIQVEVRAVYRDFPVNSSFENFRMIGSYKLSFMTFLNNLRWGSLSIETFFLLAPGVDAATVEAGMQRLVEKNVENPYYQVRLQPLNKIHLHSKDFLFPERQFTVNHGDIGRVQLFSLLAIIILTVACINYMNLSTARAQKRSKEIGVSKTVGAKRIQIIWRLYAETGMLTFVSFAVAVVLAFMVLPVFNLISGQDIQPEIFTNNKFLLGMTSVYLVTTLVAASYPVLYLSGFAPMTVIRQAIFTKGSSHAFIRKGLSVVQFSVAVILIAWVIIIHTQLNYMNKKDIGYNVQNVLAIPVRGQSGIDALINDYKAQATVSAAALTSSFPFGIGNGTGLSKTLEDMQNSDNPVIPVMMYHNRTSPEAIDLLQLKLIAGTTLPESKSGDTISYVIINRKAVEYLETTPEEIIGKRIPAQIYNQFPTYICGVVEDFHFQSLHEPTVPYGLHNSPNRGFTRLLLKVIDGNLSQQLRIYEDIFKKYFPNDLFEVEFPDMIMAKAYEEDRQTGRVVMSFSFLAILVACLGVFGLSAFMAEQRTKEIGIRKVLGASVGSIVRLFTDNYLRLLAISLVIALPVAWWVGNKYLENFAYRISLSWWIFAAAALIVIVLTLCTVGYQAIRAATANPVEAIKSE